jgi:hypothetical protein
MELERKQSKYGIYGIKQKKIKKLDAWNQNLKIHELNVWNQSKTIHKWDVRNQTKNL